ncbi:indolepyruvate ferredoxin oxidoreductase family protein [Thalassobaculum salexigens]|uniref:indolepyruvate ferredoxin oxidoreductase family protein n=1 Tax=Thalassobaculum salexigens TaxID=455360 RepID=UPI00248E54EA|nr:indolepyruvate ferredoxin oxidoreductase family protein [Thalassobaculum salexigens]
MDRSSTAQSSTAQSASALATVSLDDKYTLDRGRIFLTGVQALVRLPMIQRRIDQAAGHDTATYISGYRGSPLGTYDQQLWRAGKLLKEHRIHFTPGVNEELAATSVWGSQQPGLFQGATADGVVGLWYGKGPGVDRSGDVFKHGNFAGSSKLGGVLLFAGDDHTAKSSTVPHQSEYAFVDANVPVLNPAGVQDTLDFGLLGIALSRFSGCWIGFKTTAEIMDSTASVTADPESVNITIPEFDMPPGGLNIRWPDDWTSQEQRLQDFKLPAVRAFTQANAFDTVVWDTDKPRLVIVTTGKSYLDVRQALDDLGIDAEMARDIGLRLYKVGMSWPLEPSGAIAAAADAEKVLVIEEKRSLIEWQLKEILYDQPHARQPKVEGKKTIDGKPLFRVNGELFANEIALAIADRVLEIADLERIKARRALVEQRMKSEQAKPSDFARTPYFCSGCPHNTSTKVPDGSRAMAGIGCHFLASWMPRSTETFTQMGGEGVPWVGMAPFTETKHIFANLGDGTFNHSGSLAIRQAVAAKATMTYKILFNDAVAMTGGQPSDSQLTPWIIARMVAAEGVARVDVVTDDPDKYPSDSIWPEGTKVHHRDDLDSLQRDLRETPGVTVIIYDQTCAAEKRRRRKRGLMEDPNKRIFINEQVCEGCGDCGVQSNCVSIQPVETEFGRKRKIDQSTCNKDYSCVKGFCPSFVNVIGGKVRKSTGQAGKSDTPPPVFEALPEPALPGLDEPYGILVTGIGGTGVVTIGALIGMAAHLEGKGTSILDMTGLAQKGGAVISHVKVASSPDAVHAPRVATGSADLMLACDIATAVSKDGLKAMSRERTRAVVNTQETMTGAFTQNPDLHFPAEAMRTQIREVAGDNSAEFVDANRIATKLLGDSIASNLFMLGYAYQQGLVPLSAAAIERAIELNAVAVDFNKQAFLWGRRTAHDREAVERIVAPKTEAPARTAPETLAEMVERRFNILTEYQDAAYAGRYKALVDKVEAAEKKAVPGSDAMAKAVARYAYKLMAIKDEYEVARLYTDGTFRKQLHDTFEGDFKLEFNLAPPLFAKRDPETGKLQKSVYGPWMLSAFGILAKFKGLRGGAFDIFGRTDERRMERRLRDEYIARMERLADGLSPQTHPVAVDLALVPEQIRGYGHVKEAHVERAEAKVKALEEQLRNPDAARKAAE